MTEEHKYTTRWKEAIKQPSGATNRARGLLRHTMLSTLGNIAQQKSSSFLRCLYCHYVFDDQKSQFSDIIKTLQGIGTFVDTDKCIEMIEGKSPINGRFFHLSFDDGFRNVFQNAVPILREMEVPAIIFVPTSLIGAEYEAAKHYCLKGYAGAIEMLNWDDLRTLQSWGYEIGSHTKTHARFSDLSKSGMLEEEICGSKTDLEQQLGTTCKYISWPYGTKDDVDAASLDMTRQAGYRACFGAFRGSITSTKTSLYSIPRHHFEAQWPLAHVKYFAAGNMEAA